MQVQALIGAKKAMAFDLTAACSGFVVGLITAAQFIRTGQYRNIIIIGADALSRYVDWRDRGKTTPTTSLPCPERIMCQTLCSVKGVLRIRCGQAIHGELAYPQLRSVQCKQPVPCARNPVKESEAKLPLQGHVFCLGMHVAQ